MAITNFLNPARQDFGTFAAERPPTDMGEVIGLSFRNFRDNIQSDSAQRLTIDERRKNITLAEEILGREIKPSDATGFTPLKLPELTPTIYDFTSFDALKDRVNEASYNNDFIDVAMDELRESDPVRFASIKSTEQVREAARARATQSRTEYERGMRATPSRFTRFTGSLIGGLGAAATDPINVAASVIPFGQFKSASVLGFIAREALINSGAETAIQPFVMNWQKELGQDYGFSEAATNVAMAGLFGAAFGGVVKGTKPAASWLFSNVGNMKKAPAQFKAAAKYMSKVAKVRENTPFIGSKRAADAQKHEASANAAGAAVVRGEPVKEADLKVSEAEFQAQDATINPGDSPIVKTQKEELARYQADVGDIEGVTPEKVVEAQPKYTMDTMPQQVLDKANRKGNLTAKDFQPEEINMLKSAGIEPNARGQIRKGALVDERVRRAGRNELQDMRGKESEHIVAYNRQTSDRLQANQDAPRQVKDATEDIEKARAVFGDEVKTTDVVEALNQRAASDEVAQATSTVFDAAVEANPNRKITFEDGSEITLAELKQQFADEETALRAIRECGL